MKSCVECQRCYDDQEVYCVEEDHSALMHLRDGDPEMVSGYLLDLLLSSDIGGEIYRAHHTSTDRRCVIRIVSANQAGKLLPDAELAMALFHPNMVDVYDAGSLSSGEAFVVSEDAEANRLRDLLDSEGVPDLLTTIQVVRQVAEALDAIHAKGLTHGAINPENIVLTTDGENRLLARVKGLDLGCSVQRSVISDHLLNDRALQMLRYFAPEQCSDGARGAQSDVYGLGIVLYEMLAGKPPFTATKAAGLIEQHKHQRPPEVKIDNFDLRMLLTHTVTEALQKNPEMRQRSASAFARQMRHIEQLATHSWIPQPAVAVISDSGNACAPEIDSGIPAMPTSIVGDEKAATTNPRPSRLRAQKKKLRSLSPLVTGLPLAQSCAVVEPAGKDRVLRAAEYASVSSPSVKFEHADDDGVGSRTMFSADPGGELFSSFQRRLVLPRRSGVAIVGLALLTFLFFAGRAVLHDRSSADRPAAPPAGLTVSEQDTLPPAGQTGSGTTDTRTLTEDPEVSAKEVTEVLPVKQQPATPTLSPRLRSDDTSVDRSDIDRRAAAKPVVLISRDLPKTSPAQSSIVITYGDGRIRSKVEAQKSSSDHKRPVRPVTRYDDLTRPRVVKNPKE